LDFSTPDGDQKTPLFHSTITLINTDYTEKAEKDSVAFQRNL